MRTNWQGSSTLVGTTPSLVSIDVSEGWSMISFPRVLTGITNSEQLLQTFQDQVIDVRQIARWYGDRWQTYMAGGISFPITPGEGYFIRNFGQAGTFTLP